MYFGPATAATFAARGVLTPSAGTSADAMLRPPGIRGSAGRPAPGTPCSSCICPDRQRYITPGRHPEKTSADHADVAVGRVEAPAAVCGRHHDVLDAHAEAAGQVDAGLDREAHARLDQVLLALDHVRRLVRRQPDAVADPVDEVLAVARVGDDLA